MTAAFLIDGQGPVYAPSLSRPAGTLHRAVTYSKSPGIWAGCGNAARLDPNGSVLADKADEARLCRASGCGGTPWNRGRGRR